MLMASIFLILVLPTFGSPGDYHLQGSSPVIDSGTSIDVPSTDLDYKLRLN